MLILIFNAISILESNRRTKFAYSPNIYDFGFICMTDNWLTQDNPLSALFLDKYSICRNDRQISVEQLGSVLIAVKKNIPSKYIELGIAKLDFITLKF